MRQPFAQITFVDLGSLGQLIDVIGPLAWMAR
jgi:hypothetical protein